MRVDVNLSMPGMLTIVNIKNRKELFKRAAMFKRCELGVRLSELEELLRRNA